MDRKSILNIFSNILVWSRGDERAPNKPLLILFALGRYQQGDKKLLFRDIETPIKQLLINYGPSRKAYHPEYPFWRLQNDGIWELDNADKVGARRGNTDAKKSELIRYGVLGSFNTEIKKAFDNDPLLISDVAKIILNNHFPESLHDDIISEIGLSLDTSSDNTRRRRDPEFRNKILRAYSYQCAICGLNIQSSSQYLGIEAAHIMWHQAGGPDVEQNGLALCCMHHKFFDRGVITIKSDYRICVSQEVHGTVGLDEWLLTFHGTNYREPIEKNYMPDKKYLNWHFREVFKRPGRSMS